MRKKRKAGKILLMFMVTISILISNVNALELNKYSYTDYEYTIHGLDLYIYELNSENETTTTTENEDGSITTVTTSEDSENYYKGIPTKTINLDLDRYTINPEYKEDKLDGIDTIFIDLNLNLTKNDLESLLANELNLVSETKSYMVEIAVKYSFSKKPETYKYFSKLNGIRSLIGAFMQDESLGSEEINIAEVNNQVINIALLELDEETNNKKLSYETELTNDNGLGIFILNYTALAQKSFDEQEEPDKIIMFHIMDNIDYLIENANDIEDDAKENINKAEVKGEEYAIPNTAAALPNYVYIIGSISIICGIIAISKILLSKKNYNY